MSQTKPCPRCHSLEPSTAIFCSQCTMRLALPDMSYKVLIDDTHESTRDFLPLLIIVAPLVALVIIISLFLKN